MSTSYDSNTRAAEHPQLLEGLNKAISEYHLIEGGSFQIRAQVARLREFVANANLNPSWKSGSTVDIQRFYSYATHPPRRR